MTQQERQQLNTIIERLEAVRDDSTVIAVYRSGRTSGGARAKLNDAITELKDMVGENESSTA